ncbi:MAG: ClpX C4-type zinc finger protein [Candidatus Gastranaerophilales bacterium]|nr:ClpX C4-type zinc finger protein [Candidatus Gastranaerophilales bacterium]
MAEKDNDKVVSLSGARHKSTENEKEEKTEKEVVICSFCSRPNHQVLKMIQGPGVNICSECTMIAVQYLILEDRIPSGQAQQILDAFWQGAKNNK